MATACTVIGSEADPATSFAATNASTQDVFQANVRFDTNQKKSGRKSKSKQNEKLEVTKSSKSKKPKISRTTTFVLSILLGSVFSAIVVGGGVFAFNRLVRRNVKYFEYNQNGPN
eukprot:GHVT01040190.1.p2 GENE.GHVT01040190.1~~GHVT01040190.1.p2  ORF type:complete len:115 (+),score=14.46 GHVT01040190.1:182-526(+)